MAASTTAEGVSVWDPQDQARKDDLHAAATVVRLVLAASSMHGDILRADAIEGVCIAAVHSEAGISLKTTLVRWRVCIRQYMHPMRLRDGTHSSWYPSQTS